MAKQIITPFDKLKEFKENAYTSYHNCSFFEHDVNSTINLNCGEYQNNLVKEKIITDGTISLQRKNNYKPGIVWQNVFVTLENGTSISIDITGATFMINIINFGNDREHEIHIVREDKESLQTILNYLYHQQPITGLSSISFKSPTSLVLESTLNNKLEQETLDFNTGVSKVKRKAKRK